MRKLGLGLVAVSLVFFVALAYARRDESTNPQVQQELQQNLTMGSGMTQAPAAKMTIKGFPCDCTGRWKTNWGEMTLDHVGEKVTGSYTHDKGKIEGIMSGNSFSGTWSEAPSYQGPNDAGLVELNFKEDCKSFTGRWMYGSSGSWKENGWTGERINAEKVLIPE